jgi:hypothetical protein
VSIYRNHVSKRKEESDYEETRKKPGRNVVIAAVAVMSLMLFTVWWKTGAEDAYYEKY